MGAMRDPPPTPVKRYQRSYAESGRTIDPIHCHIVLGRVIACWLLFEMPRMDASGVPRPACPSSPRRRAIFHRDRVACPRLSSVKRCFAMVLPLSAASRYQWLASSRSASVAALCRRSKSPSASWADTWLRSAAAR